MKPEGLAAFAKRKTHKSKIYSYEKEASNFLLHLKSNSRPIKKHGHFLLYKLLDIKNYSRTGIMDAK